MKRNLAVLFSAALAALLLASSAQAAVSLSFTEAAHELSPLAPGTINRGDEYVGYSVKLKNTGSSETSPGTNVTIGLPAGLKMAGGFGGGWSCHLAALTCTSSSKVFPGAEFPKLKIEAWIFPQAPPTVSASFLAYGAGAGEDAAAADSFAFGPKTPFGLGAIVAGACTTPPVEVKVQSCQQAEEAGALPETTAGAHPFAATSSFSFNQHIAPGGTARAVESVRDLITELPAGFLGNPQAVGGICTAAEVRQSTAAANLCPDSAVVGGVGVLLSGLSIETMPLYRVEPEEGYAAAFAFRPSDQAQVTIVIRARVRSNGDYGVSAVAPLAPEQTELLGIRFATLCGYGAKTEIFHTANFAGCKYPGTVGAAKVPFITNPTRCTGGPPVTGVTIDSFPNPGAQNEEALPIFSDPNWTRNDVALPQTTGCNGLEFEPSFEGRPTTNVADAPSGLKFHLHLPQDGLVDREGLSEAHLRDTTVVLPEGMSVNPAAASGLEACSSTQIGMTTAVGQLPAHFSGLPDNCPAASKIGAVRIDTPLLNKPLFGSLFLAKQYDNPFNSLLALYVSVYDHETGIVAKLAGEAIPDPVTGRIITTFAENPQVPFEDLDLKVFEGPRASLRTPATCGPKATQATFTPWSAPESGPPAQLADEFEITTAPGGGICPTTAAQMPNAPRMSAGTASPKAGAYSPFVLRLARDDGSQEIKGLSTTLPPGLTGRLAGTAKCTEAQIAQAIARSKPGQGAAELASPSCPSSSQVGTVEVSAGAGPLPFHTSGQAYLAGPYKGAPVSLLVITPAVAGPFDLGAVTIRNPLYIDPVTTRVTVKSDPIPTILEGIPLDVRSIEVKVDRPDFTLNPTSCEPASIGATAFGLASDSSLSSRFQVGECSALAFKPGLKIALHGGTKRSDYQRLTATVTYPKGAGYANIASASVALPHSAFLAQEHIRTVCTRVQFAAKACPQGSIYGHATATTPLLDEPLSGPVYLRSSNNLLPDLVVALRGPDSLPIEVELAGRTDSFHGGIRNSFDFVPDAPVSKFTLSLQGGKKSLIVNSRDLCKGKSQRATVRLSAQNGMRRDFRTVVRNDCGKGKKSSGNAGGKAGR